MRDCDSCKYRDFLGSQVPCSRCEGYSNYTERKLVAHIKRVEGHEFIQGDICKGDVLELRYKNEPKTKFYIVTETNPDKITLVSSDSYGSITPLDIQNGERIITRLIKGQGE